MPARDGTGPYGEGQLTGRGLGPCGRGLRRGFGRTLDLNKEQRVKVLEAEKAEIEAELKRLKE